MANAQKTKGKAGEREFCKLLGSIFNENFERIPNSGSFTGGKNAFRNDKLTNEQKLLTDGDIIVPVSLAHFSIECKNYKEFEWHLLYRGVYPLLDKWISQASASHKPMWLLLIKITRRGLWACYDTNQIKGANQNDNRMLYQGKYIIESAEKFLENNSNLLIELGKTDEL